jgi:F-type H+-transporting ATPase subunit delta
VIVHDPIVVERYAQALFNAAKRQSATAEVAEHVAILLPMTGLGAKVQRFFESPSITTDAKVAVLEKALRGRFHTLLCDLIVLLLRKGRLGSWRSILQRFILLHEREQGIFEADVETARELDTGQRQSLQTALEGFTGARLRLNFWVEPELIGGVRFSYGDTLVDTTIKHKLRLLRKTLEARAS